MFTYDEVFVFYILENIDDNYEEYLLKIEDKIKDRKDQIIKINKSVKIEIKSDYSNYFRKKNKNIMYFYYIKKGNNEEVILMYKDEKKGYKILSLDLGDIENLSERPEESLIKLTKYDSGFNYLSRKQIKIKSKYDLEIYNLYKEFILLEENLLLKNSIYKFI